MAKCRSEYEIIGRSYFTSPPKIKTFDLISRCPLCMFPKRIFFCSECINSGLFYRKNNSLCYFDAVTALNEKYLEREGLLSRIERLVKSKEAKARKAYELKSRKQNISDFNNELCSAKGRKKMAEKQYILKTRLSKLNETKSRKSLDSLAKLQAKYTELRTLHEKRKVNLVLAQKTLKDFRCRLIFDLTQYIFPVLELTADGQSSLFLDESCMQISSARLLGRDLQDAAQLAYMSGRWVHTDRYGNTVIKIVESELPGNGNYSAGVANDAEQLRIATLPDNRNSRHLSLTAMNESYAIISGLCYAAELVKILSNILDVWLPRRLPYSVFGFDDFTEKDLQQAVSRLNHNVILLGQSQGVASSSLVPNHTMHNILVMLQSPLLGRSLTYKDDPVLVRAVNMGCESEESGEEEQTCCPDWFYIQRGDVQEAALPEPITHDRRLSRLTASATVFAHSPSLTSAANSTASVMYSTASSVASWIQRQFSEGS